MVLVVRHLLVIRPDLGLYLPVNRRDRGGGRRAAFARIMLMLYQAVDFYLVIRHDFASAASAALAPSGVSKRWACK